ncbi:hypothetical protein [Bradyrhizobium shewense]|uniref:hypothetical protein n=1 Tax=Bradyrhizobium shewense TaxID=1761772 RepID=UPI000B84FFA0|nr:hypothetical protein [Bradyrhizobium shewense]
MAPVEWLLAIDIAELSREMQRYRMLRVTLRRIDVVGIAPDFQDVAEIYPINIPKGLAARPFCYARYRGPSSIIRF